MTKVKICGIREKDHTLVAAEAGADFIGLIFAHSKRQVTPSQAQEIVDVIKKQGTTAQVVGVFVNMPAPVVNHTARDCNLDWVQLSGNESSAYCQQIDLPLIKTFGIYKKQNPQEIYDLLAIGENILTGKHLYLLDSRSDDNYGGTGVVFDWNLAQPAAKQFPVIIAGGLTPENVTQAIETIIPWGVDTSSGVEIDGVKDITKIKAFIEAVRKADER